MPLDLGQVLDLCLLGAGLPAGEGLLKADEPLAETGADANVPGGGGSSSRGGVGVSADPRRGTSRACTFLQCLIAEGTRVCHVLSTMLDLRARLVTAPPREAWEAREARDGRAMTEAVVADCCVRGVSQRAEVARVVMGLVEWLGESPQAWRAVADEDAAGFEEDIVSAVTAVTACATSGTRDARYGGKPSGKSPGISLDGRWGPTEQLDRLVALAVAGRAEGSSWAEVLARLVAMGPSDGFAGYAIGCVERSVCRGGIPPFGAYKERRLPESNGRLMWLLLERCCETQRELGAGGMPAVVLGRMASAAITACRELRCVWLLPPMPCLAWGATDAGKHESVGGGDSLRRSDKRCRVTDLMLSLPRTRS